MSKPIINKIVPFDADKGCTVSLSWNGSRAYGSQIIIRDAKMPETIVFDDTISSFSLVHAIPPGILLNGREYIIQAVIFDREENPSPASAKVNFYTYKTPDFYFYNLPKDHVITNASFDASMYYFSADMESIDNYRFYLYDSAKKELLCSDVLYDDMYLNYTFRGLESNCVYYLRCTGTTIHGMPLDTGYIEVTVKYETPDTYSRIYAVNKPKQGCISVATNLIIIQYNGTEEFEYNNSFINLINRTLYYDKGFLVEGDFTLIIRGMHLWQTREILKMKNDEDGLTISSRIYTDGMLRFKLTVPNGIGHYILYTEPQKFSDADLITICLRRINNIYQLQCFTEINFSPDGDMWYGFNKPTREVHKYDTWFYEDSIIHKIQKEDITVHTENKLPERALKYDLWFGKWKEG
ncbi:MAG: hypothetical protein K2K54_12720 [Lachnospiraceae bacterium]|nr:hypothetical protein [Lachnospiraceae bacterium]